MEAMEAEMGAKAKRERKEKVMQDFEKVKEAINDMPSSFFNVEKETFIAALQGLLFKEN